MTWTLTPELEEEILIALESGMGLRAWCSAKEGRPTRNTVLKWQRQDEEFCARCAQAREAQADLSVEEQEDIAAQCLSGVIAPDVARVVIGAKQWRASTLAPRKYGAKVQQEISNAPGQTFKTSVTLSPEEAYRRLLDGES